MYSRRMSMLGLFFVAVAFSLGLPQLVAADETDAAQEVERARFELGLSLHGAVSLDGGRCTREASDVVGCTGLAYGMLSVAAGVRLKPWLSLGVVQGLGLADRATVWQLTAEARVHPLRAGAFDPSLGFDAGMIQLFDRLPDNEVGPSEQVNNLAGTVSALVELAWQLTDAFALHLDTRVRYLGFPRNFEVLERVSYDTTWLASVGVGARYRW